MDATPTFAATLIPRNTPFTEPAHHLRMALAVRRAPYFLGVGMTFSHIAARPLASAHLRAWHLIPLALALSFGLTGLRAQAAGLDEQGKQMHGMHHMRDGERMGAMRGAHLAAMKKQLHLTAEQEPAWNQWLDATKPTPGMGHPEMKKADWAGLTTPQRLDKMQAMHEEHSQRMSQSLTRHAEATKAFYAAMTAAQQKTFDDLTLRHLKGRARSH
jgi:hypothetical protein